jgi:hypothetical protein
MDFRPVHDTRARLIVTVGQTEVSATESMSHPLAFAVAWPVAPRMGNPVLCTVPTPIVASSEPRRNKEGLVFDVRRTSRTFLGRDGTPGNMGTQMTCFPKTGPEETVASPERALPRQRCPTPVNGVFRQSNGRGDGGPEARRLQSWRLLAGHRPGWLL